MVMYIIFMSKYTLLPPNLCLYDPGRRFRRESVASWERVESMISFPLGRDIWGPPGSTLKVPVTVTNTDTSSGTTNTFFLTANDAFGTPVTLDQSQ